MNLSAITKPRNKEEAKPLDLSLFSHSQTLQSYKHMGCLSPKQTKVRKVKIKINESKACGLRIFDSTVKPHALVPAIY